MTMKPIKTDSFSGETDGGIAGDTLGQKPAAQDEPTRLNLALSRELAKVVEDLAASTDSTKTAVIRQAIALMRIAHEEKKKGRHLGFVDDSRRLDTEIIGAF